MTTFEEKMEVKDEKERGFSPDPGPLTNKRGNKEFLTSRLSLLIDVKYVIGTQFIYYNCTYASLNRF